MTHRGRDMGYELAMWNEGMVRMNGEEASKIQPAGAGTAGCDTGGSAQSGDASPFAPDKFESSPRAELLVADVIWRAQVASAPRASWATISQRGI